MPQLRAGCSAEVPRRGRSAREEDQRGRPQRGGFQVRMPGPGTPCTPGPPQALNETIMLANSETHIHSCLYSFCILWMTHTLYFSRACTALIVEDSRKKIGFDKSGESCNNSWRTRLSGGH